MNSAVVCPLAAEAGEQAARLVVARAVLLIRVRDDVELDGERLDAPRSLLSSIRLGEPVPTAASSALKSAGIVVWTIVSPTTLRARSGWISAAATPG